MTYKTRQEVLRAAADWMDVCEAADFKARCKYSGFYTPVDDCGFNNPPSSYEFPLSLLEGKEVWVGSELYKCDGGIIVAERTDGHNIYGSGCCYAYGFLSWNPPKPKTVMVKVPVEWAKSKVGLLNMGSKDWNFLDCQVTSECKKALENMK